MEITVTVCDVCKDSRRPTERYLVSASGASGITDRCEEHGEELKRIILAGRADEAKPEVTVPRTAPAKKATPARKAPAKKATRGRGPAVVDFSEVERARKR